MQAEEDEDFLLARRYTLTTALDEDPYNASLYLARSDVYSCLQFPDLAACDAYKVLLLVDELDDGDSEFHEEAFSSARAHIARLPLTIRQQYAANNTVLRTLIRENHDAQVVKEEEIQLWAREVFARGAYVRLARSLASCGCLRTAYNFLQQALSANANDEEVLTGLHDLLRLANDHFVAIGEQWPSFQKGSEAKPAAQDPIALSPADVLRLPDVGLVRRELYPWNILEADRSSSHTLVRINEQLSKVAPMLEARLTELPAVTASTSVVSKSEKPANGKVTQLGLFAKEDIPPGARNLLRERSILAVNARLYEPLCDACCATLPSLASTPVSANLPERNPVACPNCDEAVFCSEHCLALAQSLYHSATCETDFDTVARSDDIPPTEAADALYTLLLLRALAMASAQECHPLELPELNFIWGDFTNAPGSTLPGPTTDSTQHKRTLPFSFRYNILLPLTALSYLTPTTSVFTAPNGLAEGWVLNTILAKLRGTASARLSRRDGRPEVAAVHPLWCLANHSCDPNVTWEWAGEVEFWARDKRVAWRRADGTQLETSAGLRKDEEVLNHYVDVDLPVQERRAWGRGALGGDCMCDRCVWEEQQGVEQLTAEKSE